MATSSLKHFIKEVLKTWGPLTSEVVANCRGLLEELVKAPVTEAWMADLCRNPQIDLELYRDPEYGFILSAYTEMEGRYRVPHDHGSGWVIYAVQSGEVEMGTYCRNMSQKGELSLVRRESFRMHPGDCKVFLPGDIHDTRCVSKSVLILRFTSCDLQKEDREGRMIRYPQHDI